MRQLLHRRVPQIAGAYLAASWVLLEFTDWAVNQYRLSPALTNFVVASLLLLLPAVLVLAWRHGAPGEDPWTKTDAAVIGINLIAAGGVLMAVFSGEELGAATTVRLLEDDAGDTVERVLPKAEFRRDVMVWDFDNESGDPGLDWLRGGLWLGLVPDLYQDIFVAPYEAQEPRIREQLTEAGYDLPYGVPLGLKRRITESIGPRHFLEGEILEPAGDTLVVRTRLYETRNAREVAERTYRGTDPLEIVDRMSVDVRRDLGIPDWQIEESVDLPVADILTDSPEAFRLLAGTRRATFENRLADVRDAADSAAAIDPTFASAHATSASASLLLGDQAAAREGIGEALRHAYRLPERSRLLLQMIDRMIFRMDPAGALQTGGYWTELYPQDLVARQLLAQAHAMQGDVDGMIRQYRALLAMDSTNVQSLQAIAAGFRGKEQYDSALVYYDRLVDLQPTDVQTRLDIAATKTSLLRFDEAREDLEQARVTAPDDPDVLGQLARLDMQLGRYDDARHRLEEMSSLARTPQQRDLLAGTEETYYYSLGRYDDLRDAYLRRLASVREYLAPIQSVQVVANSEVLIYAGDWGREAFALAQIDSMRATVEEPWAFVMAVPAAFVHLDREDLTGAAEALADLRALDAAFGEAPARNARIRWVEGRIADLEDGECSRAVESYQAAHELTPQSSQFRAWLAACQTSLGRFDEAEAHVDWLLERLPGSAKIRRLAAYLYSEQGRTAEAITELEAALDIWSGADADFRPARVAREMLDELRSG